MRVVLFGLLMSRLRRWRCVSNQGVFGLFIFKVTEPNSIPYGSRMILQQFRQQDNNIVKFCVVNQHEDVLGM